MERKLATVRRVKEIRPIEGADKIELAIVDGWQCVVKKGDFRLDQLALYLEIDSWVPHDLAPFLSNGKEPRAYNGVKGERLRTIRLRGQLSQGLLLSDGVIRGSDGCPHFDYLEGDDVTEVLGIQKWERPIPTHLQGRMRGNFPSWLRKTDQERVQNLGDTIDWSTWYETTMKLDGSSMTIWFHDGAWGVCSRNVDLKLDQEGNAFVNLAKKIVGKIAWPEEIAIQGELMGPGVQGNRENLSEHDLFVFDIFDIAAQVYFSPSAVRALCHDFGLTHVPILDYCASLSDIGIRSVEDALAYAEGKSMCSEAREGVVFKRYDGAFSFKAISNKFLLGEK